MIHKDFRSRKGVYRLLIQSLYLTGCKLDLKDAREEDQSFKKIMNETGL